LAITAGRDAGNASREIVPVADQLARFRRKFKLARQKEARNA
jgi:hypothetical protein